MWFTVLLSCLFVCLFVLFCLIMGYLVLSTVNISYIEMKVKKIHDLLVSIFYSGVPK